MDSTNNVGSASATDSNKTHASYSGDTSEAQSLDTTAYEESTEKVSVFESDDTPEAQTIDTGTYEEGSESIFTLINQLSFNVEDSKQEQFFSELETALNNGMLMNFLIGHTDGNGQISA